MKEEKAEFSVLNVSFGRIRLKHPGVSFLFQG